MLESLLDDAAELDPRLVNLGKEIPIFKCGTYNSMPSSRGVAVRTNCLSPYRFFSQQGNFRAILNSAEQNFGGIGHQIWTAEDVVIRLKGCRGWLAVDVVELIKNIDHLHTCMPTASVDNVQQIECIVDTCIVCGEARLLNVPH